MVSQGTPPKRGTIFQLLSVIGVAIIVATLFTAWSDPGLLPSNLKESIAFAPPPEATQMPAISVTPTQRSQPLVGVVAGHSGSDSGAVCNDGLTERTVNETVASYVQQLLVEEGYDVDMLQEFDPKLNGYQASALVSIHADSCDYINDQATGFKVSSALANPHPERAARLTACIRNRYSTITGLTIHNSITTDMTSYHAFDEIHESTTAVIIEVGFLNLDRQILTQHPDLIAEGIISGLKCFINNEDINNAP
jgi:N-acetylmuramoyl-L-alanine amidase